MSDNAVEILSGIKKWKRIKVYIGASILTIFIFVIIAIIQELYPFGEYSLLVWDGKDQYLNFYGYLKGALGNSKENLLYSFSNALGGDMFGLSAYYLFSPYFLVFAFFPKTQMILAVHVITLLKHISAAVTFCAYLNARCKGKELEKILFSVTYSYIGYTTAFFMISPWME